MSNYYNTVNKNPIVIKNIKPSLGLEKTKEFKKKLEDKKKGRKKLKEGGLSEKRKKNFTSPMKRQRKLDALKFEAQKTGGNVMSMDEMQKLKGESDKSYESRMKKVFKAKGGRVGLKGGSFPDLSGDGKTTFKDILIGRGVIKKKTKKKVI